MKGARIAALLLAACRTEAPPAQSGSTSCLAVADSMSAHQGPADPSRRGYSAHLGADTSAAATTLLRACSLREWVELAIAAGRTVDSLEELPTLDFPGHPNPPTGEWRRDAWGTVWAYRRPDGPTGPIEITSAGADRVLGTSDDIVVLK